MSETHSDPHTATKTTRLGRLPAPIRIPTNPLSPADPTHIGEFTVIAKLGMGATGAVYLCETSGHVCAVKVLRVDTELPPESVQRFHQEVATAQLVQSPFVARVFGADLSDTPPHFSMEYVDGISLEALRQLGPIPREITIAIMRDLIAGLDAIHRAGVLHRDLKPLNIVVAEDRACIIDFGIARAPAVPSLTGQYVVGTPGYIAPERILGKAASVASDIFSLGAVWAYIESGRHVMRQTATENDLAELHSNPDLAGIETEIVKLLTRCLNPYPEKRPTLNEFAHTLGLVARHTTTADHDATLLDEHFHPVCSDDSQTVTVETGPRGKLALVKAITAKARKEGLVE